jgi:tRNA threonylcarbamoyl adenosine modification protein YeaZ
MKILGIEFSSAQRSVAVLDTAGATPPLLAAAAAIAGEPTRPFTLIDTVLAEAGWDRDAIQCLAIGVGPGSYTGIRMAIAIAQGWQLARDIPTHGATAPSCLAYQLHQSGHRGRVHIAIDAQRLEFYLAEFDLTGAGARESGALRLASRQEIDGVLTAGGRVAGPGLRRWFPDALDLSPDAASVCRLTAATLDAGGPIPAEELEAIYLREISYVKAPAPRNPGSPPRPASAG